MLAPTTLHSRERLEEEKLQLVLDKLAESTRKSYSLGWRWWALFCRARGISPLRHVTPDSLPQEESLFLDFAVHVALHGGKAAGTLQQYLSAVRSQHLVLGFPDPTRPMLRLWMAMDGLRKRQGGPKRKRPATPEMLRWLRNKLDIQKRRDDAMLWCAMAMAYFFLLRASEYVAPDQSGSDNGKGVRALDLVARKEGTQVKSFRDADEVALCIRGSKTDQLNRGEWRNHFRTPEGELCVVAALEAYERHAPECFTTKESDRLFRWGSGPYLLRGEVQATLEAAAMAVGADPGTIGTHSLRIGGASALWAAYKDSALVRRWGRWSSDAFHGYLWESREGARGVASSMGNASLGLV